MRPDEVGPEFADIGPKRSRVGRPKPRPWVRGRVALLLAGAIGLPWLPTQDPSLESPDPPPTGLPRNRARDPSGVPIRCLAFSPDGQTLATVDERGRVRLRPAVDGQGIEREVDIPGFSGVVAFSPDGRYLAVGRDGPDVILVDLLHGGQGRPAGIPVEQTSDLRFSPDGRTLAVSRYGSCEIILWDIELGKLRMILRGHTMSVSTMAFAPDGRSLASATLKGFLLWDLATGRPRHRLMAPSDSVPSLAYSPDSRRLAASISGERSVRVWDVRTGNQVLMIGGLSFPAFSVAFSPDGRLLAMAVGDGTARLCGAATGRELRRLDGRADLLRRVALSPDGRTLAATGNDEDIRFWDLDSLIAARADP